MYEGQVSHPTALFVLDHMWGFESCMTNATWSWQRFVVSYKLELEPLQCGTADVKLHFIPLHIWLMCGIRQMHQLGLLLITYHASSDHSVEIRNMLEAVQHDVALWHNPPAINATVHCLVWQLNAF